MSKSITVQQKKKPETPMISPPWLGAMIPANWMAAAIELCQIQAEYNVPAESMEIWINLAQASPIPLVDTIRNFAKGDWIIEVVNHPDGSKGYNVKDKNPILIPNQAEINLLGKQA